MDNGKNDQHHINEIRKHLDHLDDRASQNRDARIDRSQLIMVLANLINHAPTPTDDQEEYQASLEAGRAVLGEVHANKKRALTKPDF